MSKIIAKCPSCGSSKLNVSKIECKNCSTKFEGHFEIPALLRLSQDDLIFILDFIKCSGSLKEMAKNHKISYPTMRNMLNSLIEKVEKFDVNADDVRMKILTLLEDGKINAAEAAKMFKNHEVCGE